MGYDELIEAIGESACRQCEEIIARAEKDAGDIVRAAEAQRESLLRSAGARGAATAAAAASRILSTARLDARRETLAAQNRIVEAALHALEARLGRLLLTQEYRELLGLLLAECLAESPDPVTVRCRREDRPTIELYACRLKRGIRVEESDLPLGGVETAAGPEGRFVCRNAFADRLERARPLLLREAGRLLLGLEGAGAPP